ncbi:MAG: MgtC/SapB family protein [Planctomycetota bacterium]|nr:MgtC/SapB family protein [Planctomycetota bacterium]
MNWHSLIQNDLSDLPTVAEALQIAVRLLVATLLGALVGFERQSAGKAAGLRTHMLVSIGAALFMVVANRMDFGPDAMSRVMQGIVTGIGFLGGGTILKLADEHRVKGLTTAAGIWMMAAIGVAAGSGKLATATIAAVLTFVILRVVYHLTEEVHSVHTSGNEKI